MDRRLITWTLGSRAPTYGPGDGSVSGPSGRPGATSAASAAPGTPRTPGASEVTQLTDALRAALDGSGPALAPVAHADDGAALPTVVDDDVALVVRTSGSSGGARAVALDADALLASARATQARLGGPARWVLALPVVHVAGLQVLVRSLVAGTEPVLLAGEGFTPQALADAVDRASGDLPVHTALVPTQLHRVVAAATDGRLPAALAGLTRLGAVLVGGAAAPAPLVRAAHDLGLPVVTTYGMTETSGGCVYDGVPLDGVDVVLEPDGTVRLAGPVLARGYLDAAGAAGTAASVADPWLVDGGRRWLRTPDLGRWADGRLEVLGRRDDVLVTGGVKVVPAQVEEVLAGVDGVGQVVVVGVPDAEWGSVVTAVVVPAGKNRAVVVPAGKNRAVVVPAGNDRAVVVPAGKDTATARLLDDLRAAASRTLGSAAAPRDVVVVDHLPERGPGKIDRAAVARLAAERAGRRRDA